MSITQNHIGRAKAVMQAKFWSVLWAALMAGGVHATAQTPIPPSARDFAVSAEQTDQYEILAAQDAEAQSQNAEIQSFAKQMIEDHTKARDSLVQAIQASGMPPVPRAMSSDQSAMLAALQSLRGAEFDKAYIKQQILGHHQALAVAKSFAASGSDANLRKLAGAMTTLIQHHLATAQEIQTHL